MDFVTIILVALDLIGSALTDARPKEAVTSCGSNFLVKVLYLR